MFKGNDLEKAILTAAQRAAKEFDKISGGSWLGDGPESFLQIAVGIDIARQSDRYVGFEKSPKKLQQEMENKFRGQPPKIHGKRFDLVVWQKATDKPRAIIEVKRSWNKSGPIKDAEKIAKHFRLKSRTCILGYLLVYVSRKKQDAMLKMFEIIAQDAMEIPGIRNAKFVDKVWGDEDEGWRWSIGLIRLDADNLC